jgi:hypothetical protein
MSQYFLLYDGPSEFNGKRVGVIARLGSSNRKTGGMVETYVLVYDVAPDEAARKGLDAAVCGGCPKRLTLARRERTRRKKAGESDPVPSCYVILVRGAVQAWNAWMEGRALPMDLGVLARMAPVRVGSYGDPMAVPLDVWAPLLETEGARWTGYTHAWRNSTDPRWSQLLMASLDKADQYTKAKAGGWRTFRVQTWQDGTPEPVLNGEKTCPASKEAGYKTTCQMCNLCAGTTAQGPDIATIDHGASSRAVWKRWTAKASQG